MRGAVMSWGVRCVEIRGRRPVQGSHSSFDIKGVSQCGKFRPKPSANPVCSHTIVRHGYLHVWTAGHFYTSQHARERIEP